MDQINERALTLADLANCSPPVPQNTSYIAECLRSKTVEELLDLQEAADAFYLGINIWLPSFDGDFFEQDIPDLLESGAYSDTDLLIGSNEDEGAFVTFRRLGDVTDRPFITETQFNSLTLGAETNLLVSGLQKIIYNNGKQDESWNYEEATSDVLGDLNYICNITSFARQVAAAGSKVYMYSMTQKPVQSIFNVSWLGQRAGHAEDLQFVFGLPFFARGAWTYEELKISYYVIRMWTNFAKSGNPNIPVGLPRSIPEWPRFLPDSEEYKELDISFSNNRYLRAPYCEFWETYVEMIVYLQEHLADVQDGTYGRR
ncbi:putative cholinesterase-like [Apostichopus japonicus]|uniref:Putative cholinesterase-like n=1 Tax=Stichopus japonicus TaxID=307972 RepID=A0A2G8K4K0_STIJA|nr:putative cholinesterase-like [Apostichopus japonicus]